MGGEVLWDWDLHRAAGCHGSIVGCSKVLVKCSVSLFWEQEYHVSTLLVLLRIGLDAHTK